MKFNKQTQDEIKKNLGYLAAQTIEDGMVVGLGTGSTAYYFIEKLIERAQGGLSIKVTASSEKSGSQAQKGGLELIELKQAPTVDLTVDGADEVDTRNRLIKGGGGAHTREKILAACSKKILIIVDESKLVEKLGHFHLPVEILPFGFTKTIEHLEQKGFSGKIRKNKDSFYITDNGNYIFDIHQPNCFEEPEIAHLSLISTPGVVETGFFLDLPIQVMVGYADGHVAIRS
jgi:ribose 5-phosphate isomerase A